MSYQTIDDIPATATSLSDSDKIEVRQSGITKKSPLSVLLTYMQGALTFPNTSVTPSAPTRALGTTYQNTSGKVLRIAASIKMVCASPLLAGQEVKIELMSDSATTPTTVRSTMSNAVSGVLSLTNSNTQQFSYDVPPNHYYRTVVTNVTGSPATPTVVNWTEEVRT